MIKYVTAGVHDYTTFLLLSIAYSVLYMPTLALTNSLAFAGSATPSGSSRACACGGRSGGSSRPTRSRCIWLQTQLHPTWLPPFLDGTERSDATARLADCLRVSGVMAVMYGLWAMFALPSTPPSRNAENPWAFTRAFALLRHRGFAVATLVALPIAMIHQVYFFRTGPFLESLGYGKA